MSLEKIRKDIDKIDNQIQDLLEKRFFLVLEALKYKKLVLDKKREEEILNRISSPYIQNIFKSILKNSKKKQRQHLKTK